MELLQPGMLWGMGAVVIPVAIHLWHQKKGQTLAWAAMRWLQEKDQQQQRGLKFDNWLLLFLRCLLILLLALLLSQPVFTWFTESAGVQKIHLVQPDPFVVDNFRFELDEALKKGEAVFWSNAATEPVENLTQLPDRREYTPTVLQSSINTLLKERSELHLYLLNDRKLAATPFVRVPATHQLHTVVDSARRPVRRFLAVGSNRTLFVDQANTLVNRPLLPPGLRFETRPAHAGPLAVLLQYRDKTEQKTVAAALTALSEVYGFDWQIDTKPDAAKSYNWVLTDREVAQPKPESVYVISGRLKQPTVPNVVYVPEKISPPTAEMARTGQLPEWLGELLVRQYSLTETTTPLSPEELKTVFVSTARPEQKQPESLRNGLLLVFVMLVGAERWMAFKKNA